MSKSEETKKRKVEKAGLNPNPGKESVQMKLDIDSIPFKNLKEESISKNSEMTEDFSEEKSKKDNQDHGETQKKTKAPEDPTKKDSNKKVKAVRPSSKKPMTPPNSLPSVQNQNEEKNKRSEKKKEEDNTITINLTLAQNELYQNAIIELAKDEFEITDFIAVGGYGLVLSVQHINTNAIFAVKCIKTNSLLESSSVQLELALLKTLKGDKRFSQYHGHKTIGKDSIMIYLELETEDLKSKVDSKKIDMKTRYKFLYEMIDCVQHLHSLGFIHQDLKPSNYFISKDGTLRLGDFGMIITGKTPTKYEAKKGTPSYNAPEKMMSKDYDSPNDIWSLAIVIYFLFTGTEPTLKMKDLIKNGNDPMFPKSIPEKVQKMIIRMLQHKPEDRPTAQELFDEVKNLKE